MTIMQSSPFKAAPPTTPSTTPQDPSQIVLTSPEVLVTDDGDKNSSKRGGAVSAAESKNSSNGRKHKNHEKRRSASKSDGETLVGTETLRDESSLPLEAPAEDSEPLVPDGDDPYHPQSNKRRGKYERDEKRGVSSVPKIRSYGSSISAAAAGVNDDDVGSGRHKSLITHAGTVQRTSDGHNKEAPFTDPSSPTIVGNPARDSLPGRGSPADDDADDVVDDDDDHHHHVRTPRTSFIEEEASATNDDASATEDYENRFEDAKEDTTSEEVEPKGDADFNGKADEPGQVLEQNEQLPESSTLLGRHKKQKGTGVEKSLSQQKGKEHVGSDDEDAVPEQAERSENRDLAIKKETKLDDNSKVINNHEVVHVLWGDTGKGLDRRRGSRTMRKIVAKNSHLYALATSKDERNSVVNTVIKKIRKAGARFMKRNDERTGWIECDPREIHEKVSQAVRDDCEGPSKTTSESVSEKSAPSTTKKGDGSTGDGSVKRPKRRKGPIPPSESPRHLGDSLAREQAANGLTGLSISPDASVTVIGRRSGPASAAPVAHPKNDKNPTARAAPGRADLEMLASENFTFERNTRSLNGHVPDAGVAVMVPAGPNIPSHALGMPFTESGASLGSSNGIFAGPPQPMDVVLGREALLYSQEGNFFLQNMVRGSIGRDVIPTELKLIKARAILERMLKIGSRFCIKETDSQGLWYQLSDLEAQDIIYRGLCEEEKRIQVLFGSPKLNVLESAGAGRGRSLPVQHPDIASRMLGTDPSRPIAPPDPVSSQEPSRKRKLENSEPPRKKYKKRLRKITEEAKASKAEDEKEQSARQEPSFSSSSETSSDEGHTTILEHDIDIGPYDVILGRGRGSFNHPGNQNLIDVFRTNKVRYGNASKLQKTRIAREIVTNIQKKGGRFLKRHGDDRWEVIANRDAYRKVCHGIRDLRESEKQLVDFTRKDEMDDSKKKKKEGAEDLIPPRNNSKTAGADKVNSEISHQLPLQRSMSESKSLVNETLGAESVVMDLTERDEFVDDDDDDDIESGSGATEPDAAAVSSARFGVNGKEDPTSKHLTVSDMNPQTQNAPVPLNVSYKAGDPVEPRDEDVVCGRGKALNRHPGNQRMHRIVRKYKYRYRDARNQDEKAKIANKVLSAIHSNGGRLLRLNDKGQWQELEYKVGLKKVYHSIRDSLYNDDGKRMKKQDDTDDDDDDAMLTHKDDDSGSESVDKGAAKVLPGNGTKASGRDSRRPSLKPPLQKESAKANETMEMRSIHRGNSMITERHDMEVEELLGASTDPRMRQGLSGRPLFYNEQGLENISDPMLRARLARGMADPLIRAQLMQQEYQLQRAGQGMPASMLGMQGFHGLPYDVNPGRLHAMASLGIPGAGHVGGMALNRSIFSGSSMGGHTGFASPSFAVSSATSVGASRPTYSGSNLTQEELRRIMHERYGV